MSAQDQLREVIGTLYSRLGSRSATGFSMPVGGPATPEQRIAALEHDIQALYKGIEWAGGQIDYVTGKLNEVIKLNNLRKP